jgi:hypothetical protein
MFDPRLLDSSVHLTNLALCQARLQADPRWPWIVLIPLRAELREIEDLTHSERTQLPARSSSPAKPCAPSPQPWGGRWRS